jgi:hypothetical protein
MKKSGRAMFVGLGKYYVYGALLWLLRIVKALLLLTILYGIVVILSNYCFGFHLPDPFR